MCNFTIIPFCYFLKTRLKNNMQRLSWIFVYFVPSMILFNYYASFADINNVFLFLIGVTVINYVYENGYIQNDVKTIKKEVYPTIRLSNAEITKIEKYWNKIFLVRIVIFILLIFAFYTYSNSFIHTFYLVSISLLLQLLFIIYNYMRNIVNLFLLAFINYIRFYGFIVPFIVFSNSFEFFISTFLLYPLAKFIEFTKRKRFNLLYIGNKIKDVDQFRICYYFLVIVLLFLLNFNAIFIVVAIYYLLFRSISCILLKKSKMIQKKFEINFTRNNKIIK